MSSETAMEKLRGEAGCQLSGLLSGASWLTQWLICVFESVLHTHAFFKCTMQRCVMRYACSHMNNQTCGVNSALSAVSVTEIFLPTGGSKARAFFNRIKKQKQVYSTDPQSHH